MIQNIKSVLVGLTEEGRDEPSSALAYGMSLAAQAGAHITVQAAAVKLVLTHAMVSNMAASLVSAENRRIGALAEAVAERARGDAVAAGVGCSVEAPQLSYADLLDAFVKQARVHDLAIIDAEEATIDIDRGLIEQVVFESGRPLVVVPVGCDTFSAKRIVIGWDGSAPAVRAVNDAMPFLCAAEAVEILSIAPEKALKHAVPGAELAPHLARHGVNVTVNAVPAEGDVASKLQEQASLFRADLLVLGAFNHSLLREWLLGGVTQALLKDSKLPLFLSH